MAYTTENVRNLEEEDLSLSRSKMRSWISELEPQLAQLKAMQGKTADVRDLYDLKLEIEEFEERRQEAF